MIAARHAVTLSVLLATSLGGRAAWASRYDYRILDVQGSSSTEALVVNDYQRIAGTYTVGNSKTPHMFMFYGGLYTKFAGPPGFEQSSIIPTAIGPTGLVAGIYGDGAAFPFYLPPGAINVEKLGFPTEDTHVIPLCISHDLFGNVCGREYDSNERAINAFNTQENFQEWVAITVPLATSTVQTAFAYDHTYKYERPAGNYVLNGHQHGFTDSSTAPIDPPGSVNTSIEYFNDNGDLGGYAVDQAGTTFGFVRRGTEFTIYKFPGAKRTTVVKNVGPVVFGEYTAADGSGHGYQFSAGGFHTVGPGLDAETTLTSVGLDGSFVGTYVGKNGRIHGYLATCNAGLGRCSR